MTSAVGYPSPPPGGGESRRDDELITGEAVALTIHSASFGLRALSAIIDVALGVLLYVGGIIVVINLVVQLGLDPSLIQTFGIILAVVCFVAIPLTVEVATRGRSLGRIITGSRIVRLDGGPTSFRHALIRSLLGVIELYMTLGGLAAIVGILTPRTQRLGDLVAGTYAQYERVSPIRPVWIDMPVVLTGWAPVADVARLPTSLSRRIGQFLRQQRQLSPEGRARIAGLLADEARAYVAPWPDVDAETALRGIAVIRRDREAAALGAQRRQHEALEQQLTRNPHDFPSRG